VVPPVGLEPADLAGSVPRHGGDQLDEAVDDPQAGVAEVDGDGLAGVGHADLDALPGDLDAAAAGDFALDAGAKLAEQYADRLPRLWEQAQRPCSPATVAEALDCMNRRRLAHHDRYAVLVHSDIHEMNALQASDGSYKLIDPAGLRAEPACDLGTIVRCNPDLGDDLWVRTEQLASRTGVDATAIWEWGTIHRVVSGVYACSIGFQPFGDLLLAEADRLTS
jgi:streptomycin 6-kinase